MTRSDADDLRAYVTALARATGDSPDDTAFLARVVTALPSLVALTERLGPWPTQPPAAPLDPGL